MMPHAALTSEYATSRCVGAVGSIRLLPIMLVVGRSAFQPPTTPLAFDLLKQLTISNE